LVDVNAGNWKKHCKPLQRTLDRQVGKGTLTEEQKNSHISQSFHPNRCCKGAANADLVVEAATENIDLKLAIFKQLDEAAHRRALCWQPIPLLFLSLKLRRY
jgi:3-hydroxybutyryl-CoA dehydrogenase